MNIIDKARKELIREASKRGIKTPRDFLVLKNEVSEKYRINSLPNYGLSEVYNDLVEKGEIKKNRDLEKLLKKAKMRTLSGVAVVSVLTKPYKCPGMCLYCPSEKDMPKSYLSNEPAVMRAILCKFDPYKQVQMRLKALEQAGHATDKVELIIMGGSFNALPLKYQYWFVKECYRACQASPDQAKLDNEFGGKISNLSVGVGSPDPTHISGRRILMAVGASAPTGTIMRNLKKEQKRNERAKHRVVGLTLETRPDLINEKEIKKFREMGCTKVEIGVQSIYDEVLEKNKRGHGRTEVIRATKLLKDAGFKVSYHMMPNLLGSDLKKDYEMFEEIFSNPSDASVGTSDFQPDLLKIYPCVVTENSELYDIWKEGGYRSYTDDELFELLIKIKKIIPPHVRISRLIRDIPEESIISGNKKTNLRQLIKNHSQLNNWKCNCIRCREIKDQQNNRTLQAGGQATKQQSKLRIDRIDYEASGGKEIFLQYIDQDNHLYSMLRLRISVEANGRSPLQNAAIIREVHTYGEMMGVGASRDLPDDVSQHKGLGRKLIEEAERIAKEEFGMKKIAVIAGVGAREYYRKLKYEQEDTYMIRVLDPPTYFLFNRPPRAD